MSILRGEGHRLLEAIGGREALAIVKAECPDLVITDILMPGMDGYAFAKQLRLDPATSAIPVVFSTAHYGEREARAFAVSSGISDVLTKPTEPKEVLKIVSRLLSGQAEDARPGESLTTAIDREHLRLLNHALSEKRRTRRRPTRACARSSTSAWAGLRAGS